MMSPVAPPHVPASSGCYKCECEQKAESDFSSLLLCYGVGGDNNLVPLANIALLGHSGGAYACALLAVTPLHALRRTEIGFADAEYFRVLFVGEEVDVVVGGNSSPYAVQVEWHHLRPKHIWSIHSDVLGDEDLEDRWATVSTNIDDGLVEVIEDERSGIAVVSWQGHAVNDLKGGHREEYKPPVSLTFSSKTYNEGVGERVSKSANDGLVESVVEKAVAAEEQLVLVEVGEGYRGVVVAEDAVDGGHGGVDDVGVGVVGVGIPGHVPHVEHEWLEVRVEGGKHGVHSHRYEINGRVVLVDGSRGEADNGCKVNMETSNSEIELVGYG